MEQSKNKTLKRIAQVLIVLSLIGISIAIFLNWSLIFRLFSDQDYLKEVVSKYSGWSALLMIGLQALQIVVAFIPGEITQIASGYVFGIGWGTLISIIGLMVGAAITFYFARILGHDFVKKVMKPEQYEKFSKLLNSPKGESILFLLLLIPGLPKDFLFYLMGITDIQGKRFFPIVLVARIPSIIGSAVIGANLADSNFTVVIIVSVIALIAIAVGFFFKDNILKLVSRKKDK